MSHNFIPSITDINNIVSLINLLRTNPSQYSQKHVVETDLELKKLLESRKPVRPVQFKKELKKCSDELMEFLVLNDGAKEASLVSNLYTFETRLRKCGIWNGASGEIIMKDINASSPVEIVNLILHEEKNRIHLFEPSYNFIGLTYDILPCEKYCIVIDFVQFFRSTGDLVEKTVYEKRYSTPNDLIYIRKDKTLEKALPKKEKTRLRDFYVVLDRNKFPFKKPNNANLTVNMEHTPNGRKPGRKGLIDILSSTKKSENTTFAIDDSIKDISCPLPKGANSLKLEESLIKDRFGNDVVMLTKSIKFEDGSTLTEFIRKN